MSEDDRVLPTPTDLLSDPKIRARFEEKSAALEAADLVRQMRRQALSASGVRGLSQDELAQRTGLSQPRISQIEKGEGRDGISYALLRRIAYACGIDWGQSLRAVVAGKAQGQSNHAAVAGTSETTITATNFDPKSAYYSLMDTNFTPTAANPADLISLQSIDVNWNDMLKQAQTLTVESKASTEGQQVFTYVIKT
jgi:transcriptional regulator with XRE-family HTH domain